MHVLITGERHTGKSTLLRELSIGLPGPVFGFVTQKEYALADPEKGVPVYIYAAGKPCVPEERNLIGYCKDHSFSAFPAAFDRFAPELSDPPKNGIILMDEIGFLEAGSKAFRHAVLSLLNGDVPVLAAVKPDDHPFLNAVRAHPNCRVFELTGQTRKETLEAVRVFIREQGWKTGPEAGPEPVL